MKKRVKGFTLVELVAVIIILGILSVTAAPKFLNLQSDARVAVLKGLKAAIKGADAQVYAKAAIQGVESLPRSTINIQGGIPVTTYYGHAETLGYDSTTNGNVAGIAGNTYSLVDGLDGIESAFVDNGEWMVLYAGGEPGNTGAKILRISPHGVHQPTDPGIFNETRCSLTYRIYINEIKDPEFELNEDC